MASNTPLFGVTASATWEEPMNVAGHSGSGLPDIPHPWNQPHDPKKPLVHIGASEIVTYSVDDVVESIRIRPRQETSRQDDIYTHTRLFGPNSIMFHSTTEEGLLQARRVALDLTRAPEDEIVGVLLAVNRHHNLRPQKGLVATVHHLHPDSTLIKPHYLLKDPKFQGEAEMDDFHPFQETVTAKFDESQIKLCSPRKVDYRSVQTQFPPVDAQDQGARIFTEPCELEMQLDAELPRFNPEWPRPNLPGLPNIGDLGHVAGRGKGKGKGKGKEKEKASDRQHMREYPHSLQPVQKAGNAAPGGIDWRSTTVPKKRDEKDYDDDDNGEDTAIQYPRVVERVVGNQSERPHEKPHYSYDPLRDIFRESPAPRPRFNDRRSNLQQDSGQQTQFERRGTTEYIDLTAPSSSSFAAAAAAFSSSATAAATATVPDEGTRSRARRSEASGSGAGSLPSHKGNSRRSNGPRGGRGRGGMHKANEYKGKGRAPSRSGARSNGRNSMPPVSQRDNRTGNGYSGGGGGGTRGEHGYGGGGAHRGDITNSNSRYHQGGYHVFHSREPQLDYGSSSSGPAYNRGRSAAASSTRPSAGSSYAWSSAGTSSAWPFAGAPSGSSSAGPRGQ